MIKRLAWRARPQLPPRPQAEAPPTARFVLWAGPGTAAQAPHHGQQDGGRQQSGAGEDGPGTAVSEAAGALARAAGFAPAAALERPVWGGRGSRTGRRGGGRCPWGEPCSVARAVSQVPGAVTAAGAELAGSSFLGWASPRWKCFVQAEHIPPFRMLKRCGTTGWFGLEGTLKVT